MKKKFFNKRKIKLSFKNTIIIVLIIIFIGIKLVFNYINSRVTPILISYATVEAKKISSIIVNQSINSDIKTYLDYEKLFIMSKNNNEEIVTFDFNPQIVNQILVKINSNIHKNFNYLEKGNVEKLSFLTNEYNSKKLKKGIIYEISTGMVLNNSILRNIGPKVPVKLNLNSNVESFVNTKITNYGINNALMEVFIDIEIYQKLIMPFVSESIVFNYQVPLLVKMIQGTVPNYYFNGIDKNSISIATPNS